MESLKKVYYIVLILLPIALVGSINLVSQDKIIIKSTNIQEVLENRQALGATKTTDVEVYGHGFNEGDTVYIDGEPLETVVAYDKQLVFGLPTKYLTDSNIRIKIQRKGQSGRIVKASKTYTMKLI